MGMNVLASLGYKRLVSDIVQIVSRARKVQVSAYWEIGQRIVCVEQKGSARAPHNSSLLEKLSGDLTRLCGSGFSVPNLRRMRAFYLSRPKRSASSEMDWSQYVELLPLENEVRRLALEKKAVREGLSSREIRQLVRAEAARERIVRTKAVLPLKLLTPVRGISYTYRILNPRLLQEKENAPLIIDLGFFCSRDLDAVTSKVFKPLDLVESVKTGDGQYRIQKTDKTNKALYTYRAAVEKVIDADTLRVIVDLGFGTRIRQYLRLRGINSPELDTPEGRRAHEFVKLQVKTASEIILTSSRPDKYGRYLADVFFVDPKGSEIYLNNLLLQTHHAVLC